MDWRWRKTGGSYYDGMTGIRNAGVHLENISIFNILYSWLVPKKVRKLSDNFRNLRSKIFIQKHTFQKLAFS